MSDTYRVWRTDIGDEAVTERIEAYDAYSAARGFAEQEWAKDQDDHMELEIEDSSGNQFVSEVEIEMVPEFDISCRKKQPTHPDPRGDRE